MDRTFRQAIECARNTDPCSQSDAAFHYARGRTDGFGEWGFSALVERWSSDPRGHGSASRDGIENARDLKVDLSDVQEVVLTHDPWTTT